MNERQKNEINAELEKEGLRIAGETERGYYALANCDGTVIKVWATDLEARVNG